VSATPPAESPRYRGLVLAMLLAVYTLNYVDRQIVGILALPIKRELQLSDSQLGLMSGLAFAIFYSTLGVPIARLADRFNRVRIVAGALVIWSGFTAMCGLAGGFASLFLARIGVGIGEAGGIAPSFSLVADYFPPDRRARALAILTLGLPLGTAIGLFVGGFLAVHYGWRSAFLAMGVVGLVVAPVLLLVVREPRRGRLDAGPAAAGPVPSLAAVFRTMRGKPTFWLVALGSATASMLTYGLGFWLPSFMQRSHGLDVGETSRFLAAIALTGGVAGTLLGGFLSDHLGQRDRRAYCYVPAIAFVVALPALLGAITVGSLPLVFALLLVPQALNYVWTGPSVAVIQNLAPPTMRTTASALYLLIVNFIGLGLGTLAFGALSDLLTETYGNAALRYAILICGVVLYPITAGLYALGARVIRHDWPA
jgi:predicted MFS family arabinose efflux permease